MRTLERTATTTLVERPRRTRETAPWRRLVRETRLRPAQLVLPLFIVPGRERREPVEAMPGVSRISPDLAVAAAREAAAAGIGGLLFFGVPDVKDAEGTGAWDPAGPVPAAIRGVREAGLPLVLAADVCMCEYTDHGHCGILRGSTVDNDGTLPLLARAALAYADAGADVVAPSAMMDGQVGALREALDGSGHEGVAVMAYASKHASAFYGPFREAAGSTPAFGDRRAYQMDPANGREAMREMDLDAQEGADILMVKPAMTSLDLLARARDRFDLPLAAYQVSGEFAMLEAASQRGWIDRRRAITEALTAIARAGADIVISYFSVEAAGWLVEDERLG